MPRIFVVADTPSEPEASVVYREPVALEDFESTLFSDQLVERVCWAVVFADQIENGNRPISQLPDRVGAPSEHSHLT